MVIGRLRHRGALTAGAAALALSLAGCDDSTGVDNTAELTVLLTDAPSDYVEEAMVDIGFVELVGGAGGPVVLTDDGTDGMVNLLDLQNEATLLLADAEIEAGSYAQLRLQVEAASVTLKEGYTFNDGSTTQALSVPSGAQTGIKLNLHAGDPEGESGSVEIAPGQSVLVLDFDVNQSFRLQGNPETAAGLSSVSFQPTLRVIVEDVAGSIAGTVSTSVDPIPEGFLEGLVISAEPVEGTILEPYQTETATAVTEADGSYTLYFLVPGTYEVSVQPPEGDWSVNPADAPSIEVGEDEDVFEVDFEIVPAGS
ncbi:MAG: DUF4382 domain-containing protein [Gemmatimonadota bacterium]|jgi:hypothetical protein